MSTKQPPEQPTAERESSGIVRFLGENKVYWLVPLILVAVLLGIVLLTRREAAPFVYSLF